MCDISNDLDPEKVYEAIALGVECALWRMITNATDMPTHDFFASIQDGAEKAFSNVVVSASED